MSARSTKRIFLTGTIRNGGRNFPKRIESIIYKFEAICNVEFFVVESDSSDDTVQNLVDLTARFKCFSFKTLGGLEISMSDRIARLAYCRNVCLDEFRIQSEWGAFDYFGVIDLDGVNDYLSIEPLQKAFTLLDVECDAIFPNQKNFYYDIGALRARGWVEENPHVEYAKLVARGMSHEKAFKLSISDKMRHINRDANFIEVDSAFGGLGIYKAELARKSSYLLSPRIAELNCVEHVVFNRGLGSEARLLIVPWLTNATYTEHTLHKHPVWKALFLILGPFRSVAKRILGDSRAEGLLRRLQQFILRT